MSVAGLRAALALATLAGSSTALACGESLAQPTRQIEDVHVVLVYRTTPDPVGVGRHFGIDFTVCPRGQATLPDVVRVDAHMPEHKHGMNYRPGVTALGQGRYRAEGLMFHMPGRWELVFELRGSGAPVRLTQSLQVD
jgi:YtkA-like